MTEEGVMFLMIVSFILGWISHWAKTHENDDISINK